MIPKDINTYTRFGGVYIALDTSKRPVGLLRMVGRVKTRDEAPVPLNQLVRGYNEGAKEAVKF